MNERVVQFRVGVFVLASAIIAATLILMFSGPAGMLVGKYTIYVEAPTAPNVDSNTPIKKSGVLIGRVSAVELLDQGGVRLTCRIDSDKILRHNEVCEITTTMLGDAELSFIPSTDPKASKVVIAPDSTIHGMPIITPVEAITRMQAGLSSAIDSVSNTSVSLGKVVDRIDTLLAQNEQRINHMIVQSDEAIAGVNEIISDRELRERFKQSIAEMPKVMEDARKTIVQMQTTFESLDRNLRNVEGVTEPLGKHGPELVARIEGAAQNLEVISGELVNFSRAINNEQGTLGRLVRDPELYDQLYRAAQNINQATCQLEPILRDARVFTDKIARHPGVILRDAARPGAGIK